MKQPADDCHSEDQVCGIYKCDIHMIHKYKIYQCDTNIYVKINVQKLVLALLAVFSNRLIISITTMFGTSNKKGQTFVWKRRTDL